MKTFPSGVHTSDEYPRRYPAAKRKTRKGGKTPFVLRGKENIAPGAITEVINDVEHVIVRHNF